MLAICSVYVLLPPMCRKHSAHTSIVNYDKNEFQRFNILEQTHALEGARTPISSFRRSTALDERTLVDVDSNPEMSTRTRGMAVAAPPPCPHRDKWGARDVCLTMFFARD